MKKMLKKISSMFIILCSLFTMFMVNEVSVSAQETTEYVSSFEIKDSKKGYIWESGSVSNLSADRKDIYFFNFPDIDNEVIGDVNSITIDYTTCKFKLATWCVVESKYKRATINKEDTFSYDLYMGYIASPSVTYKGIMNSVGKVSDLVEIDNKASESGIIGGIIGIGGTEEETWQTDYEYYFIMPTLDSPETMIISANIYNKLNGKNEEWNCVGKGCLLYNETTGSDILGTIKDKLANAYKWLVSNEWAIWGIIGLIVYSILSMFIPPLTKLFSLIWFVLKYTIFLPITLIANALEERKENKRIEKQIRRYKEKNYREENRERRRNERYIENTQYNDKKLRKYRDYKW